MVARNITVDYEVYFKSGDPDLSTVSISERIGDTDIFLALNEKYLMVEINENNTDFLKENFDIEVFYSSSTGYIQKAYAPENTHSFVASSTDNVDYYMNILVDKEIPLEVIRELNIDEKALSTSASRLKLNRDLYSAGTAGLSGQPGLGDENEEPC